MKPLLAASILSVEPASLAAEIASVEGLVDWLQVDVMDGKFVENRAFPIEEIREIHTSLPLDFHLMVADPEGQIPAFLELKPKHISFHAEAVSASEDRLKLIEIIHTGGATAGIAINPQTQISEIQDVISAVDLVLVMSVQPGKGGQKFLPEVLSKVKELRAAHPSLMIQMDGGINAQTAKACIEAGANNLVLGSYLFKSTDKTQAIAQLFA